MAILDDAQLSHFSKVRFLLTTWTDENAILLGKNIADLLDTIDALRTQLSATQKACLAGEQECILLSQQLAEAKAALVAHDDLLSIAGEKLSDLRKQLEDLHTSHDSLDRQLTRQAELLQPMPECGHRRCDWIPIAPPNVHADPDIREAYCRACAQVKAAEQAAYEKAAQIAHDFDYLSDQAWIVFNDLGTKMRY
jgi:hypothetical protein